jgi:hypothetical protein
MGRRYNTMSMAAHKWRRRRDLKIARAGFPTSPRRSFFQISTPAAVTLLGILALAGLGFASRFMRHKLLDPEPALTAASVIGPASPVELKGRQPADPTSLLETGRRFAREKDWARAEGAYRSALAAEPRNREALVGLSDVLYEQHRYEESAAELNRLWESAR